MGQVGRVATGPAVVVASRGAEPPEPWLVGHFTMVIYIYMYIIYNIYNIYNIIHIIYIYNII